MANAVFTTKVNPAYDDLPEIRYHFPRTYLNQAEQAVGDWILYYEPRREDDSPAGRAGRQCYFATARVLRIEPDPIRPDHFYAYVADYLEFTEPVPFRQGPYYPESALRKVDGSTNKGAFGRAVRVLPAAEYQAILQMGLAPVLPVKEDANILTEVVAEEVEAYEIDRKHVATQRALRDAAFTQSIQSVYQATCAMTGLKLINGGGRCEIEAAHIRAVEHQGPDSIRNGIALSRTIHWMFDRGILSMEDNGQILQSRKLVPEPVGRMLNPDGIALLPDNPAQRPHSLFLRFHRERVFKGG
jgi:putative restriction endonuclease